MADASGDRVNREGPGHREIVELLPWYANGTLTEQEHERVEAHLAGCEACRNELEILRGLQTAVTATSETPSVSPDLLERTVGRIRDRNRPTRNTVWRRWLAGLEVRTAIAVTGIALVFLGLGLFLGQQFLSDRSANDRVAASRKILSSITESQEQGVPVDPLLNEIGEGLRDDLSLNQIAEGVEDRRETLAAVKGLFEFEFEDALGEEGSAEERLEVPAERAVAEPEPASEPAPAALASREAEAGARAEIETEADEVLPFQQVKAQIPEALRGIVIADIAEALKRYVAAGRGRENLEEIGVAVLNVLRDDEQVPEAVAVAVAERVEFDPEFRQGLLKIVAEIFERFDVNHGGER
ncbi:MAG: zf-HC2 domain-containing protein [Candidatus Bipolaricaulia bacterium]